jgi:hypothetical protein
MSSIYCLHFNYMISYLTVMYNLSESIYIANTCYIYIYIYIFMYWFTYNLLCIMLASRCCTVYQMIVLVSLLMCFNTHVIYTVTMDWLHIELLFLLLLNSSTLLTDWLCSVAIQQLDFPNRLLINVTLGRRARAGWV